jgi:hypothetical protein
MHVYAPPQQSYRAIALAMVPRDDVVFHPMRFPESETYHFEPLNERVQVYERPFPLIQDVTLAVSPAKSRSAKTMRVIIVDAIAEQAKRRPRVPFVDMSRSRCASLLMADRTSEA